MGAIVRRGSRFYVRFTDADGKRRMIAAKGATRREHAATLLNTIERNIIEGRVGVPKPAAPDPAAERRRAITLREIGETFCSEFKAPRIKDPRDYRMEARSVLTVRVYPTLGDRSASAITQLDVENLRDALSEKYAPQSVTNTMNTISKIYGWARKQGLIDCDNPCKGAVRPRSEAFESITREKYLSKDEAAELMRCAEDLQRPGVASRQGLTLYPMIATALYAGLRRGELAGLRWSAIDFDRKQIEVSRSYDGKTKSGKTRHVPLAPALAPILRAWRDRHDRDPGELVFPVEGRMGRAYETLGLGELMVAAFGREPPKPWHALRHSFASHLVMGGANILSVSKLLGHADVKTTLIYAHLSPDHLASEVGRLNFSTAIAGVTPITTAVAQSA